MQEIKLIQGLGFAVYMRNKTDKYCYYTDGTRIAYAQWDRFNGGVSSVHKPNSATGTGFSVSDIINKATIVAALDMHAPHWLPSYQLDSIKKWKNWAEFQGANVWNSGFSKVETV